MRKFLAIVVLLLLATTIALIWVTKGVPSAPVVAKAPEPAPASTPETSAGDALIGGDFTLLDQNGSAVSDSSFRGKLMLVFFGFTRCQDECPAAAAAMSLAMEKLGNKAQNVVPVFISVDAAHDTPTALKDFLGNFDKRFVGLTGSKEQLASVAQEYKVYASESAGDKIDHSAYIYLMGKDGKYITHFPNTATGAEMATAIANSVN